MRNSSSTAPDSAAIKKMFNALAGRYDLFNQLTSIGMATEWRAKTLEPIQPGMRILDLGCGTGDLTIGAAQKMNGQGEATGLDFSENMLFVARQRSEKMGLNTLVHFVLRKAEELPIENQLYDCVISGFVLRNLYEHIDAILLGVHRSLKNGGFIRFVDITEPKNGFLRVLWKIYMTTIVEFYGQILFGKNYPTLYIIESAKRFPRAEDFVKKLQEAGFHNIKTQSFMLGIITLYHAEKPL